MDDMRRQYKLAAIQGLLASGEAGEYPDGMVEMAAAIADAAVAEDTRQVRRAFRELMAQEQRCEDAVADTAMDHPPISPSVRPCCGRPWEEDCDCEELS